MGKAPAFQFYPGDWRRDTQVQMASMETRGVWFEMLCCMWDAPERGKLEGTIERLSQLLGCAVLELERSLKEIAELKIGNVTFSDIVTQGHKIVTVINRRMEREERYRNNAKIRKRRQRSREDVTHDVTTHSSSSSSFTPIVPKNSHPENGNAPHQEILSLWKEILPEKPQPKSWPETRQTLLRSRWKEEEKRQNLDYWKRLFKFCRESPFLMGDVQSQGRPPFVLTLPWLLKQSNFLNVIERKYHQ